LRSQNVKAVPPAASASEPATAESLGWQLRSALPPMRLHSVSLCNTEGDVIWLSEGALGPDEHSVLIEAIDALTQDPTLPYYEFGMEDGRISIFLAIRAPQGDLVGLAMIIAELKSLSDNLIERMVTPQVRTILQKIAVLMRPAKPAAPVVPVIPVAAPAATAAPASSQSAAAPADPQPAESIEVDDISGVETILTLELIEDAPEITPDEDEEPAKSRAPAAAKSAPNVVEIGDLTLAPDDAPVATPVSPKRAAGEDIATPFTLAPDDEPLKPAANTEDRERTPQEVDEILSLSVEAPPPAPKAPAPPKAPPAPAPAARAKPPAPEKVAAKAAPVAEKSAAKTAPPPPPPPKPARKPEQQPDLEATLDTESMIFVETSAPVVTDPASDLALHVQQLIKLRSNGRTRRFEVLARSRRNPTLNQVPDAFINESSRGREGAVLDGLVVQRLLAWLGENPGVWNSEPASFSINLSIGALEDENFPQRVASWLSVSRVSPECVGFEITEFAAVQCRKQVQRFVEAIEKLGCFLVLDNFTMDSAAVPLLASKSMRMVKMDPRLTNAALKEKLSQAMVVAISQACKVLGLHCVAKRIESQPALQWLTAVGIDFAQGYLLEKPMPIDSIAKK
jgi:EAL domain-containing protein (putative c-di-GMP-specific phosphodiesterase class I)